MKIQGEKYEKMKAAMRSVVLCFGTHRILKEAELKGWSRTRAAWQVWNIANDNLLYDDTHPFFVSRQWVRIHPHDKSFDVYSDGVQDKHVETAVVSIAKELGILP